jgi:20S proteasome subunit beta 6
MYFDSAAEIVTNILYSTDKCVIASAGMQSDAATLHKTLKTRLTNYLFQHGKPMSTVAIGQMISNMLYHRRFFPYYTFNLVAGLDNEGRGVVYGYDAIGSYQAIDAGASGTGQSLIQPLLDSQKSFKNQLLVPTYGSDNLSLQQAINLVKDSFTSAGERDIYTGDSVEIVIIDKNGYKTEKLSLKRD